MTPVKNMLRGRQKLTESSSSGVKSRHVFDHNQQLLGSKRVTDYKMVTKLQGSALSSVYISYAFRESTFYSRLKSTFVSEVANRKTYTAN